MRAVVQRVSKVSVFVLETEIGRIDQGLLVYLGVSHDDSPLDAAYLIDKILNLRIFNDELGVMNKSIRDKDGEIMLVSQFTLLGDARKGRRPSYGQAASPQVAQQFYDAFVQDLNRVYPDKLKTGKFQADMQVVAQVDGPVTLLLDSRKLF